MRFGYRRLTAMLVREGISADHKRVYRLYREEGLAMRIRQRRGSAGRVQYRAQRRAARTNVGRFLCKISQPLCQVHACSSSIRQVLAIESAFRYDTLQIQSTDALEGPSHLGIANGAAVVHGKNGIATCAYGDAVVTVDLNFFARLLHLWEIGHDFRRR
ncbi:MAG: hypothetical protein DMG96_43200 [Acidobacteria bacterium]|nr:MAG: hypothetical protein DMG96_43200 [Acidobacteriota bacterium]